MRWKLELIYDDGRREHPLADLPGEWFAQNWLSVVGIIGRRGAFPRIRLISDDAQVLVPVLSETDLGQVEWWRVLGSPVVRPDLRSALSYCQSQKG